jgi:Ca2+-binding RTX toxin-like protein
MPQAAIDLTPEIIAELFNPPTVDSAPTPVRLDTGEVATVAKVANPPISNSPERTVISSPLTAPDNPNFFSLTSNADAVELTPGSLGNYPGGLLALDNNDFINGSADSERMNGNRGADTLAGGGNDTLGGGKDFDVIVGGFGNDVLNGEKDNDRLYGNEGNDFIRGGKGDDELFGGLGRDTLVGDKGLDRMEGGGGADVFVLRSDTAFLSQKPGFSEKPGFLTDVPADFILDYNAAEGDAIALIGVTQNDVVLVERFLTIDSGVSEPETTNVTIITEADSGNILGWVKATPPAQIQFAELGIG